ncbi:MAG: hypothetical protein JSW11_18135 [Candidatus Heimdallarchaeota archaeon]|nr:MAG: hypothetical protein JSW11_18135 [Candidatus Heimdallarchaeota archaeon]
MTDQSKIILYVKSINIDTRSITNQQGAGKHAKGFRGTGFISFKNPTVNLDGVGDRVGHFYSDKDWNAINIAKYVQENTGIGIKIVDVRKSLWNQIKFTVKGFRTPLFVVNGETLSDISNTEQLLSYLE